MLIGDGAVWVLNIACDWVGVHLPVDVVVISREHMFAGVVEVVSADGGLGQVLLDKSDSFGLADIAAAPYVVRFFEITPGEKGLRPRAEEWWQRIRARPSFEAAVMEPFA